jgi:hypothetical protein
MKPFDILPFRLLADEIGQDGADRIFRHSLRGALYSYPMQPIGAETDDVNTVGHPLGWSLLDRAANPGENAFWADFAENCLVIVADLNGPMAIRIAVQTERGPVQLTRNP